MDKKKKASLLQTYRQFMEIGLSGTGNAPLRQLVDEQVMGFGTTVDEKIIGVKGLKKLLDNQKKQSKGLDIKWKLKPVYHSITPDENTAVFADDVYFFFNVGKEKLKMYLRFSIVLSFSGNCWKVIHWHGSKPENVESEKDTYGVENWKEKAEALEKLVAERTMDLLGKNKELKVETSLERVRTVAMGMKQPDDMLVVCEVITRELISLGVGNIRNIQTAVIDTEKETYQNYEYYQVADEKLVTTVAYKEHPVIHAFVKRMVQDPEGFYARQMKGGALKDWIKYQAKSGQFVDPASTKAASLHYYFYSIGSGALGITTYAPLSKEAIGLFKRFRNVFQLAYARFVDIRQAEEQARDAQIEAALERVRSRSMAMHKSDELKEVIRVVLEQFIHLNIKAEHAGFYIDYKDQDDMHIWLADPNLEPFFAVIPYFDTPTWNSFREAKAKGITLHTDLLDFKTKNKFYKSLFKLFKVPEKARQFYIKCKGLAVSTVLLDNVGLYIENFSAIPYTDQENDILMRFGNVFQQTYTRFLDLQKAEAQAREAQIEASLERVRSRSMAMRKSEELAELSLELVKQVQNLGVATWFCAFNIYDNEELGSLEWGSNGQGTFPAYRTPREGVFLRYYQAGQKGETLLINEIGEAECPAHYEYLCTLPGLGEQLLSMKNAGIAFPASQIDHVAFFKYGYIIFITYKAVQESHDIFVRFARVFEQTYTRFLDLQRSEAQAKEAQIEAALERVRSRTMGMQKSEELAETVSILFKQLIGSGIEPAKLRTCGIATFHEDEPAGAIFMSDINGDIIADSFTFRYDEAPSYKKVYEAWKKGEDLFVLHLTGQPLVEHFTYVRKYSGVTNFNLARIGSDIREIYFHVLFFSKGYLFVVTYEPIEEHLVTLKRFGALFQQTYTRFLDLQKAEAQAREAQIETALEKVRSRTLAMQKSDELAETASVLFQQLILLGIEPNRLYITIIHADKDEADFWITNEDGSRLTDAYSANLEDNSTFKKMYEGWKKKLHHLVIDMQGEELQNYFHYLQSKRVPFKGGLEQKRRVQHLAYFSKGFIGLASPEEQPVESVQLLERFAAVFNLTFTRFNDLQVAEAHAAQSAQDLIAIKEAKQKAEEALQVLQATQKQLVQAEKMASLGELTAGIAHEIQNPLNFVNNFSEVSKELLDEMREAIEKGDAEEAKEIMNDVIQNLDKINHHGKRADGIVKGMLQHSSSGSGKKEPTDINALADEYLRLAYHGLRAKDKSFNATLKTEFDDTIGKISVIPQDIGRVILNLITNAFYAAPLPPKGGFSDPDYVHVPTIWVSTKRGDGKVIISVRDNGPGIPEEIRDKIFQPFFTTKPTGQGTGLGLSLSYDIVKAHGGELKVETKEGEGSEFFMVLPI